MPSRVVALVIAALMLGLAVVADDAPSHHSALRAVHSVGAQAQVEVVIAEDDASRFAALVEQSVAYVEQLFGRRFIRTPHVVFFASAHSFAHGTAELFGYSSGSASFAASAYGGIFDRDAWTIAMNMATLEGERLAAALDHELAHHMIREASAGADLPVWLEEGIATLTEQEDVGSTRWAEQDTLVGRAIAASGRISLGDLSTLAGWHATYPRFGPALYAYATEAVRLMEGRVGWPGLVRLLAAVGRGAPFAEAYRASAGETISALEGRLDASSEARIISRAVSGGAVEWTLFTGVPDAAATVTIAGASGYVVAFTVITDGLGLYRGSFGSPALAGTYVVSAAGVHAVLVTMR